MSKSAGFFIALLMVVAGGLLLFKLWSNGDGQTGQEEATIDPDWQPRFLQRIIRPEPGNRGLPNLNW